MNAHWHWNKAVSAMIDSYQREEEQLQFDLDEMFFGWDALGEGINKFDPLKEREIRNRLGVIRTLRAAVATQLLDFMVGPAVNGQYGDPVEIREV